VRDVKASLILPTACNISDMSTGFASQILGVGKTAIILDSADATVRGVDGKKGVSGRQEMSESKPDLRERAEQWCSENASKTFTGSDDALAKFAKTELIKAAEVAARKAKMSVNGHAWAAADWIKAEILKLAE